MTAIIAGLAIVSASTQPGAQAFGVILVVLGGLWRLLKGREARS